MNRHILCCLCCALSLSALPAFAQIPAPPPPAPPAQAAEPTAEPPAEDEGPVLPDVMISGGFTSEVQGLSNPSNSSKLTEYRDLRDSFLASKANFFVNDRRNGWFFDFSAANLGRIDEGIRADGGRPGRWSFLAAWSEIPHNYSNHAVIPYIERSPGVLEVPATIPITFKKLATGASDKAGVLASDALIAAYQGTFLKPTPLRTQTNAGHFVAALTPTETSRLAVTFDRRGKTGSKAAFGPIGDRPPRTLNIQLTEPVDYRTNNITVAAEHEGRGYDVHAEYLFSDFENRIDTLRWQNVYATAAEGVTFDTWDRLVGTFGVRPLPPDNRYHNGTVNVGVDMPADSRLMGSVSFGRLEQNQTLLPYANFSAALANPTLPRATADALMHTMNLSADYVVTPVDRLTLRGFFRRADLNNDTRSSQWQYVTQDTSNLNGTVAFLNKRVNLPFAWDRRNGGVDGTYRLAWLHTTLQAGAERETIAREHREADTGENMVRASIRVRPRNGFSVQGRYLLGVRDSGTHNGRVTRDGYWYSQSEVTGFNNPVLSFDNHPDMRRFDLSDRRRKQADLTVNVTAADTYAVVGFLRYRNDDFESDVVATQPLLGTGVADQFATTPGTQLGLLENRHVRSGIDVFVEPVIGLTFNAFVNYDRGTGFQRGLEFQENNKVNPSAVANASLGPWTRASSQWTADTRNRAWFGGAGTTFDIISGRAAVTVNYSRSNATIDIAYGGFGVTNFDGTPFPPTNEFAFPSSPPAIREKLDVTDVRLEIPVGSVTLTAGYTYEKYHLVDWQQGSIDPWVEPVGSGTLLRDSSQSHQWGNRLFNLGTFLAPDYAAHLGYIGFRYRF